MSGTLFLNARALVFLSGVLCVHFLSGCVDNGEGESEDAVGVCQSDQDCEPDEWCMIPLSLATDITEGTCGPLDVPSSNAGTGSTSENMSNVPSEDNCLADSDCPRGLECIGGRCGEAEANTSNSNTSNSNTSNSSTSNDVSQGCREDQDCSPSEECCDGSCAPFGSCSTEPTGECSADSDCEAHQECCPGAVCQVRGTCSDDNDNNNNNNSSVLCSDACNYMTQCTDLICPTTIIDLAGCLDLCSEDPVGFQASLVVELSCTELNASFCADPEFPSICTCDNTGGTYPEGSCGAIIECLGSCEVSDLVCQDTCYYGGSLSGQAGFNSLQSCASLWCANATDEEFSSCLGEWCQFELEICFGM